MLSLPSPFARLRTLLHGIEPGKPPIDLSIGAPRHATPDIARKALMEGFEGLGHYPRIEGLIEVRRAISAWLERRFDARLDPEGEVLVSNGSREGLFYAALHAISLKRDKGCLKPVVAYPNPLYPVYGTAGQLTGAENLPLTSLKNRPGLLDLDAIPEETLRRLACLYICSPANPQGAVADAPYWQKAIDLARRYGFYILADECYSEIYYSKAAPIGALSASGDDVSRLISFNSLSKRSSVPGLRFGFMAGDADFISGLAALRNVCGPQMAEPIQRAATALLSDETHVAENRALYQAKMDLAHQALKGFSGYQKPEGGFCLWLNVASLYDASDSQAFAHHGADEIFVRALWQAEGVKAIPGGYLSETTDGHNPGEGFVRLALVGSVAETEDALKRINQLINARKLAEAG